MAALASCVFDAPFVQQISVSTMLSYCVVDGGPLTSRKVNSRGFGCRIRDKVIVSDVY